MAVVILLLGNWGSPGQHLYLLQDIHKTTTPTLKLPNRKVAANTTVGNKKATDTPD